MAANVNMNKSAPTLEDTIEMIKSSNIQDPMDENVSNIYKFIISSIFEKYTKDGIVPNGKLATKSEPTKQRSIIRSVEHSIFFTEYLRNLTRQGKTVSYTPNIPKNPASECSHGDLFCPYVIGFGIHWGCCQAMMKEQSDLPSKYFFMRSKGTTKGSIHKSCTGCFFPHGKNAEAVISYISTIFYGEFFPSYQELVVNYCKKIENFLEAGNVGSIEGYRSFFMINGPNHPITDKVSIFTDNDLFYIPEQKTEESLLVTVSQDKFVDVKVPNDPENIVSILVKKICENINKRGQEYLFDGGSALKPESTYKFERTILTQAEFDIIKKINSFEKFPPLQSMDDLNDFYAKFGIK